jgi:hypothetical protein
MEKIDNSFVVRCYNVKDRKYEAKPFDSKPQAEGFKSGAKPTDYTNVVIYPKALYNRIHGTETVKA